jgi:hypothetical protein
VFDGEPFQQVRRFREAERRARSPTRSVASLQRRLPQATLRPARLTRQAASRGPPLLHVCIREGRRRLDVCSQRASAVCFARRGGLGPSSTNVDQAVLRANADRDAIAAPGIGGAPSLTGDITIRDNDALRWWLRSSDGKPPATSEGLSPAAGGGFSPASRASGRGKRPPERPLVRAPEPPARQSTDQPVIAARWRSMDRRAGDTATRRCRRAKTFRRRQATSRPPGNTHDRTARWHSASTPSPPNPSRDWSPSSRPGRSTTTTRSSIPSRSSQRLASAERHR